MVMCMDESLRPEACRLAQRLRAMGRRVDVVLEDKRMKWAFKVRCFTGRGGWSSPADLGWYGLVLLFSK
jgi:hypothetical protein